MQSVTFAIESMHCAGCARTVDYLLQQVAEAVERADYRATASK